MASEERVKLRASCSGNVRELYESVTGISGVVREEYVGDASNLEGGVVDNVTFTLDIVFDSSQVSESDVVSSVRRISGVDSVSRGS